MSEGELIALVRQTAKTFSHFSVKLEFVLKEWDPISSEHKLYLTPSDGAEELTNLHERLHTGTLYGDLRGGAPFHPHITVATSRLENEIDVAVKETKNLNLPMAGAVDAMVITALGNGVLQEIVTIPLHHET